MNFGHGGNIREMAKRAGCDRAFLLDFSANINPLGPPDCLRAVISRHVEALVEYPDPDAAELTAAIARRYGAPGEQIVVGNGASELLDAAARALAIKRAVIPVPSYLDYVRAAGLAGAEIARLPLREDDGFVLDWEALRVLLHGNEAVFLGQPNNPTGLPLESERLRQFAAAHPATTFVVDEAFAEFIEGCASLIRDCPSNVTVLRSLTKFYAIPGLRLGFAVAPPELAARIRRQLPLWSVNSLAQAVGVAVLADEDYARRTVAFVQERRQELQRALAAIPGLHVYPGTANFLLVRLDRDAQPLAERLLADGIAIRIFSPAEQLDRRFFRVAVRAAADNERLREAIRGALGVASPRPPRRKRAATLMFQGASSNAGKSVLTAAMCRILLQDGVRVAPFKAQNMSLNSFVTRDGDEMGRAQVVQAQACRLEPDVRMNPILLKPNSDTGSQVIVRGKPVGNMRVGEYVNYKPRAFEAVKSCFDSLAAEFDAVILEGAGSPGEVNLKRHDIVNMRMAEYAGAPVLIVGDIDRGGVYASFVGTMEVLAAWERALVAGWIVNRFRGDASLLASAHDYTLRHSGRPVLGVVPFLKDLAIPQEDSVEFKAGVLDDRRAVTDAVEIALVDLPHISNFTDFDAFRVEPDVRLRVVRSAAELGTPDAVVIPGSKNTLGDLNYLKCSGLAARIQQLADAEIVGICGGFQMLGREIRDPHGIESGAGRDFGLGLLAVDTTLEREKTLVRTTATHALSRLSVTGYEIHHGQTPCDELAAILKTASGETVGVGSSDHRVWGTYLHGVFDADEFRRWFIDRLRVRRGLATLGSVCARYEIETALDRLAAVVRESLDMKAIYRLLKLA